ncbi:MULTISPECIES: hypothetical protein [unclassified Blastococcus]
MSRVRRVVDPVLGAARGHRAWGSLQRKLDHVVDVRTQPERDAVAARLEALERADAGLRAELDEVRRSVAERAEALAADVRRLEERLADEVRQVHEAVGALRDQYGEVTFDLNRLGPQLAALEVRVADQARPDVPLEAGSADELVEARRLVDEVLREHERIRVRFSGLALYEERLRRLEAARWPGAGNGTDNGNGHAEADGAGSA